MEASVHGEKVVNRIKAAVRSRKGSVHPHNEDSFFFNGIYPGLAQMDQSSSCGEEFQPGHLLFAVSDGIENGQNGALASYTTMCGLTQLQDQLNTVPFNQALIPWLQQINRKIADSPSMGSCTLALMYIRKDWLCMAGIGDSRIYRLYDGKLACMTHDHTKMQMLLDVKMITPAQVKVHPQRDLVTRYLGMNTDLSKEKCRSCIRRPMPLIHRDRYLICTDGVNDVLSDDRLEQLLSAGSSADECADWILQTVQSAGGQDDATLIVVDVELDGADAALDPEPSVYQNLPEIPRANEAGSPAAPSLCVVPEKELPSASFVHTALDGAESAATMSIVQTHTFSLPNGEVLTIRTEVLGSPSALASYQGMSIELKPHIKQT